MATMNTVKAAVVAMALVGSVGTALAAEPVSGVEATVTAKAEVTGGQVDGSGQDSGVQAYCWYETYCNYYGYCWTSWVCY